jgi:hypothetical protein
MITRDDASDIDASMHDLQNSASDEFQVKANRMASEY